MTFAIFMTEERLMNTKTLTLSSTKNLALTGMMAALISICGPLTIPIGPIPVSLVPLAIFLSVCILGKNLGTLACVVYILIGLTGLPVFSGFSGGIGKVLGPTGGYIIAYALMAYIAGIFIEKSSNIYLHMLGCLLGLIAAYAIGTVWLSAQASMSLRAALFAAVIPFIPFDLVKIVIAVILGKKIKERLK